MLIRQLDAVFPARRPARRGWLVALVAIGVLLTAALPPARAVSWRLAAAGGEAYCRWAYRHWSRAEVAGWQVVYPATAPAALSHDAWGRPSLAHSLAAQAGWLAAAATAAADRLPELTGLTRASPGWGVGPVAGARPRLVLYTGAAQMAAAWGWPAGQRAEGVYWAGLIGVPAPTTWLSADDGGLVPAAAERLLATLAHELTHWHLDRATHGRMPRWLGEGLAVRAEERAVGLEWGPDRVAAAAAAGAAPIDTVGRWLAGAAPDAATADRAYLLARSLVAYVDRTAAAGWEGRLGGALRAGRPIAAALREAFGRDYRAVEAGWQEWLRSKTKPH